MGEQWLQHLVGNWHDALGVCISERDHGQPNLQEAGRQREEGVEKHGEAKGPLSELHTPEDRQVGTT